MMSDCIVHLDICASTGQYMSNLIPTTCRLRGYREGKQRLCCGTQNPSRQNVSPRHNDIRRQVFEHNQTAQSLASMRGRGAAA